MFDPAAYCITVRRTTVEGQLLFEASVKELPHVRGYGENYAEAYETAIDAIESLHEMATRDGVEFPKPSDDYSEEEFSGRVTLRLPKALHRLAAECAVHQGISLNQFLVSVVGFASASPEKFFRTQPRRTSLTNVTIRNLQSHDSPAPGICDIYTFFLASGAPGFASISDSPEPPESNVYNALSS